MFHIEKTALLLLQFAKNRKSISSKLRPQEEVKNVSLKKTPCTTLNKSMLVLSLITHVTFYVQGIIKSEKVKVVLNKMENVHTLFMKFLLWLNKKLSW